MGYDPESAAHMVQLLENEATIGDEESRRLRAHLLVEWLKEIGKPQGTAEDQLCAYINKMYSQHHEPIDFQRLRRHTGDADAAWASWIKSAMERKIRESKASARAGGKASGGKRSGDANAIKQWLYPMLEQAYTKLAEKGFSQIGAARLMTEVKQALWDDQRKKDVSEYRVKQWLKDHRPTI